MADAADDGRVDARAHRHAKLTRALIAIAVMVGLAERIWWVVHNGLVATAANGELPEVARSFAAHLTLSDAYKPGQGPTAHVMPIPAIFAGLIYRSFGIRSVSSELILLVCALALAFASFVLGYLVMRELESPRAARVAGLVILLIAPLNMAAEVKSFRIWEGSLAVVGGLGFLLMLIRFDKASRTDVPATLVLSLLAALLLFVSPPLGVPAYACAAIFMASRQRPRDWPRSIAAATAVLIVVLAPWTIRNAVLLGHPVPLRSNFGLELAMGMNADAVAPANPGEQFRERLQAIHPFSGDAGYARMRAAGGEVEYARQLQTETVAWMRANPRDAATLALRHVRQYFFPSPWMWDTPWNGPFRRGGPQMVATWLVTLLGVTGAAAAALRGRRWLYPVLMLMMPVLLYMVTQPTLRYRYIGYALMVYLGADLLGRIAGRLASSEPRPRDPSMV